MRITAVLACLLILLLVGFSESNSSLAQNQSASQNASLNAAQGSANVQYYSQNYVIDGWLNVTRTIVVNQSTASCLTLGLTGACGESGSISANAASTAVTSVTISVDNVGPLNRSGVTVEESLSFVPQGVKISFDPPTTANDGGEATWILGNISKGEGRVSLIRSLPRSHRARPRASRPSL